MDLSIHTYGYYDALYYVLNTLGMFRNSEFYSTIINTMSVLVGCYYAVRMSYSQSHNHWRLYLMKTLGMLILINSLLLPKTNMVLRDHVTKRIGSIDNIPLAFALPVGLLEDFGHLLTIGFEQAFAPIEKLASLGGAGFSYYNYGMLFGARLKQELSQVRIKNPEFIENMRSFIKQCVVLPSMIGYQFTPQQLLSTNDIWGLVSKKAGTLTRLDMRIGSHHSTMTCKEAANFFVNYFQEETNRIIAKNQNTEFGLASNTNNSNVVKSALSQVFEKNVKALYSNLVPAAEILKQQMMINSLSDYASSSYAVTRGRMQQESSWLLSSDTASLYLPMLLVVIKSIVYASFIFLAPMLLLSGGMTKYSSYLILVASLQLWPSLNAIINMIMGTYSNLKLGSDLLLSFSSASTVTNHVDTIVTVAAGLQVVVPFLAFALMQSGVGGIMHLAGSVIGGLQASSGSIAAETSTGNRSFDNVSEGNLSKNIKNANKLDYNMQYAQGAMNYQHQDGTMERVNPDGNRIFSGGAGLTDSSGPASFRQEENRQVQVNQGVQFSEGLHQQNMRSYSESETEAFTKQSNYLSHMAEQQSQGKVLNYEQSGEQGRAMQQAVNYTKQLHDDHNYSWDQAAQTALKASASGELKIFGVGGGLSVEGSLSAQNSSRQDVGERSQINRENNASESHNNLIKALSSESFAENNHFDKSFSNDVRASYEKHKRSEAALSYSSQQVQDWHQAKQIIDTQGASSSREMTEELINRCMVEWGNGDKQAIYHKVQRRDPDVMRVWNKMQAEDGYVQNLVSNISSGRSKVSGDNANAGLDSFSKQHQQKINQNVESQINDIAISDNFDSTKIIQNIDTSKSNLAGQTKKLMTENSDQYSSIKQHNEWERQDLQAQVDQYEKDRIGQGLISKVISLGTGIGGPAKDQPRPTTINKGAYQNVGNNKKQDE